MARYTEIDALIEDLRYDIELDARTLDDLDFADAKERELVQLDKDIKQNTISILEQAQTADVRENIHAHWEEVPLSRQTKRCSNCHNYLNMSGVNAGRGDANFCQNCGAIMDERRGDDERT